MPDEMNASDDLRLPDELAACEAQLASEPLVAPRLSRNELLYRAGWAAAEAKLVLRQPSIVLAPLSKGGVSGETADHRAGMSVSAETEATVRNPSPVPSLQGRGAIVAWSMTSAALAASLAVAITLRLSQPASGPARDEALPSSVPQHVVDASRPATEAPLAAPQDAWLAALQSLAAARRLATGEPLAVVGNLRSARWDQAAPTDEWTAAAEMAPAMTTRALLEEMLPRAHSAEDEARGGANGVFEFLRPLAWGGDTI